MNAATVPIATLHQFPGNPRRGDVEAISRSLQRLGQYRPIVVRRATMEVLAGNHTLQAAERLGWTDIDVAFVDVDEQQARAIVAADNRLADLGSYDDEDLAALLRSIDDDDLRDVAGYDDEDLNALLRSIDDDHRPGSDDDPVPPPPEPISVRGDLWQLGDHRLLIGDSFASEDVDRLVGGTPVDLVLTDPPFAIYGSASGVSSDVADDKMVRPFFEQLGRTVRRVLVPFGHAYIHCDWRSYATLWDGFKLAGLSPRNCLVWDKGSFGLGANWPNAHEFIAFFAHLPSGGTMTSGRPTGQRQVLDHANILRYDRPRGDERLHNAAKPVPLLRLIIDKASDPGDTVLDLFGGSGSTLIACDQEGRAARLMEMDPGNADIIIGRWERDTGRKAERVGVAVP